MIYNKCGPEGRKPSGPQGMLSAGIMHEIRCVSPNRPQCLMCDYEAWRVMY